MITADTETTTTNVAVAAQGANVAPQKASGKKVANPKKGAPKGQKGGKGGRSKPAATRKPNTAAKAPKKAAKAPEAAGPREGSKTAKVVAMLQRKNGATLAEIRAYASHCTSLA